MKPLLDQSRASRVKKRKKWVLSTRRIQQTVAAPIFKKLLKRLRQLVNLRR